MKLCLIVLNYNDFETTAKFVNEIKKIKKINHIIVVDNFSTDNSYDELLKLKSNKIDVICTKKNGGYAYGNNYGAFYAIKNYAPEFIIISNPDVIISDSNIEMMLKVYEKYDDAAIVSCKMKCTSNINLPLAWKLPSFTDCLVDNLFIIKKIIGDKTLYSAEYLTKEICKVDALPGSFFMIPADIFQEINGFDENTFLYFEENILAQKIKRINKSNYLLTSTEYIHNHSISINKSIKKVQNRLKINFSSKVYYCKKYLNINKIQQLFLNITFYIGLCFYLIYIWLKKLF